MRNLSIGLAAALTLFATAADARCTRLGFSVNDYGKDGPTQDAKNLLDKYVAKWAAANNIKKYSTGKKDVTCELYLDLLVFDEYTCRAEANVCWDGPAATVVPSEASLAPAKKAAAPRPGAKPAAPAAKAAPAKTAPSQ